MITEFFLDRTMFLVVSCGVVFVVMNRFDVVRVVVVIIPYPTACILGIFGIEGFGMLMCCFSVSGGLIIGVITRENIPSFGFVV